MKTAQPKKFPAWLIALALAAMATGVWSSLQLNKFDEQPSVQPVAAAMTAVTVLPQPRTIEAIKLIDQDSASFSRSDFEDQWSLVFLGFTSCGHVCPMTMAKMRMIQAGVEKPLNVVFVSVDPNRDSPEDIHAYVKNYDESFVGVTGNPAELDKLANTLGAPYFVDTNPDNYIVDHPSTLFLIDPSASLAGTISQPVDIQQAVQELNELM